MEEHIGDVITRIQERNTRVENDKAWERSFTRIFAISLITYFCAVLLMFMIGAPNPLLSASVPVLGYVLSTQSLPPLKAWWLRNHR